jgi:small conductance mechanosensitive channel
MPTRRFELVVSIGYRDDHNAATAALRDLAAADPRALADPAPVAFVAALGESAVRVGVRVWCKSEDYLALAWAMNAAVKGRFDELGITMPLAGASAPTPPAQA